MMKKCEECGSNDLKTDIIRGEVVCNDCGLVVDDKASAGQNDNAGSCLLYTSPSPRDLSTSRMPSSA